MSDPINDAKAARNEFEGGWTPERAELVASRVERRLGQRRRLTRVGTGLAVAALVVGAFLWWSPREADNTLRLSDGSTATPLVPRTQLVLVADARDRVVVSLDRGAARFTVTRRPERIFRVEALPVAVEVLGTRFVVERQAETVRVTVEEGRVRILSSSGETQLGVGQSGIFPLAPVAEAPPEVSPDAPPKVGPAPEPEPDVPAALAARAATDWRTPAGRGEFERAYPLLVRGSVRDEPKDLLLAADVARLTGHTAQARTYLRQLLDHHAKDARAPLAAFTLGRVLIDQMGWPREAAEAFAKARSLAPEGPLAEDALAREVEAWSRAGDAERARTAAEHYLLLYPGGSRLPGVRKHGGL